MAGSSKEGYGSKRAVLPVMMIRAKDPSSVTLDSVTLELGLFIAEV
jgi:hypothetical protein